jgi:hypothetical protein
MRELKEHTPTHANTSSEHLNNSTSKKAFLFSLLDLQAEKSTGALSSSLSSQGRQCRVGVEFHEAKNYARWLLVTVWNMGLKKGWQCL